MMIKMAGGFGNVLAVFEAPFKGQGISFNGSTNPILNTGISVVVGAAELGGLAYGAAAGLTALGVGSTAAAEAGAAVPSVASSSWVVPAIAGGAGLAAGALLFGGGSGAGGNGGSGSNLNVPNQNTTTTPTNKPENTNNQTPSQVPTTNPTLGGSRYSQTGQGNTINTTTYQNTYPVNTQTTTNTTSFYNYQPSNVTPTQTSSPDQTATGGAGGAGGSSSSWLIAALIGIGAFFLGSSRTYGGKK
jgi:hypothetical protein